MSAIPTECTDLLSSIGQSGSLTILTGAGISAESGIPTFRGPEGYWTIGSENYRPEEMATHRMFLQCPEDVWAWYLHRLAVCLHAEPNDGHRAIVRMEQSLGDRFRLVTQNVDGLHGIAGNTPERLMEIHGSAHWTRCVDSDTCPTGLQPLDRDLAHERGDAAPTGAAELPETTARALTCSCGAWRRPHVLWFDECYNEEWFFVDSAMRATIEADALLIIGTSGATTLPATMAATAAQMGKPIIMVDPNPTPFDAVARWVLRGTATELLPALADTVGT